jgi:hypothetical protein
LKDFAKANSARFIELELSTKRQEGDIAGTKMKKFLDYLVSEFNRRKQEVIRSEFEYGGSGKTALGYVIVKEKFGVEVRGPSLDMTEAVSGFKKVHKDFYELKGYLHFKDKVSVDGILKDACLKVGSEMGALARIL